MNTAFDKALTVWTAPEYVEYPRGKTWYLAHGLLIGGLMAYGIVSGAWTFSVALGIAAATYLYFRKKLPPKRIKIIISPIGIKMNDRRYPYTHIKTFWINYQPPQVATFNFRTTNRLEHDITIPLANHDPALVRSIVGRYIPEWEGKEETLTELLVRALRI